MARRLKIGARVQDKRRRSQGSVGLIVGVSGDGRSRKWEVRWDGGAVEQVSARSLEQEGQAAPLAVAGPAGAAPGNAAAGSSSSEEDEEGSSSSENASASAGDASDWETCSEDEGGSESDDAALPVDG